MRYLLCSKGTIQIAPFKNWFVILTSLEKNKIKPTKLNPDKLGKNKLHRKYLHPFHNKDPTSCVLQIHVWNKNIFYTTV